MFCVRCGTKNSNDAKFCNHCGAGIAAPTPVAVVMHTASEAMSFGKSISTCMRKYTDFKGRASRAEYWWFNLFYCCLIGELVILAFSCLFHGLMELAVFISWIGFVFNIAMLLPSLAVTVRRLHDTNRSGWWMLLSFTFIGIIPLYILLVIKGDAQENRYGVPA